MGTLHYDECGCKKIPGIGTCPLCGTKKKDGNTEIEIVDTLANPNNFYKSDVFAEIDSKLIKMAETVSRIRKQKQEKIEAEKKNNDSKMITGYETLIKESEPLPEKIPEITLLKIEPPMLNVGIIEPKKQVENKHQVNSSGIQSLSKTPTPILTGNDTEIGQKTILSTGDFKIISDTTIQNPPPDGTNDIDSKVAEQLMEAYESLTNASKTTEKKENMVFYGIEPLNSISANNNTGDVKTSKTIFRTSQSIGNFEIISDTTDTNDIPDNEFNTTTLDDSDELKYPDELVEITFQPRTRK